MADISIGCAGWSYSGWVGNFYPKGMEQNRFLRHYSKYFDFVEVNSTFYNLPNERVLRTWYKQVPDDFKFSIKVWQKITHKRNVPILDDLLLQFFSTMKVLDSKITAYLLQFPPSFKNNETNYQRLESILDQIYTSKTIIIEFRDNSWFTDEIISSFIDGSKRLLCTTYLKGIKPFYYENQKKYYIRLVGDRQLSVFNRIQRTQEEMSRDLEKHIRILLPSPKIEDISVVYNNHFSGFAPWEVNNLKKKLKIDYKDYNVQKTLLDFV